MYYQRGVVSFSSYTVGHVVGVLDEGLLDIAGTLVLVAVVASSLFAKLTGQFGQVYLLELNYPLVCE